MKKLSKLLASSLVAFLAMTNLVPSASALGLKTDLIWYNENIFPGNLYVEEVGITSGNTYFYADVCASEAKDFDDDYVDFRVTVNYNNGTTKGSQTKTVEAYGPDDGDCKRVWINIENEGFDLVKNRTYTLTITADPNNELEESDETDNSASTEFLIPYDYEIAPNPDFEDLLTPDVNFGIEEIGVEDGNFYADVYTEGDVESVTLNFNANQTNNTLTIFPTDGETKRYYSWGLHTFDVEEGDTVLLTTKVDYEHEFDETTESDNMVSEYVTVPTTTTEPEVDFEITELGVDSDYSNVTATVRNDSEEDLYTTVNFSLSNGAEFNTTGNNHDLSTTIEAGSSFTFTSWGISSWTLEEDESYTLTVKVTQDGTTYDTETYTFTYDTESNTDPEPTNEDDFLMQPSLVYLEIGDADGVTDEVRTYYGSFNSSDNDLVSVDVIGSVEFEDHSNYSGDYYLDTTAGAWFTNTIIDEYDGLVLYVYPTSGSSSYRSLDLNISGELSYTIDSEDDLAETHLVGEGTDYVSLTLLTYLDPEEEEEVNGLNSKDTVMEFLNGLDLGNDNDDDSDKIVTDIEFNQNLDLDEEDKMDYKNTEIAPYIPYEDVEEDSWYSKYVAELTDLGIVSGYETGTYGPSNEVTVAEMLKIALEAAGHEATSNGKVGRHWASDYVNTAKDLGMTIVQGTVDLDRAATREEVATMLTEAFGMDVPDYSTSSFTDGGADTVEHLKQLGVVDGYDNGSFGFKNEINRAEVSKIVVNTLQFNR